MQEAPLVDLLQLDDDIPISTTTRRGHDVLVERKRDKDDDDEEINGCAHCAHAFGNLALMRLAHVATPEAGLHERGAEPADHGVAEGEGEEGERERGDERFAIAVERVEKNGDRCGRDGEETECLLAGERGRRECHGGMDGGVVLEVRGVAEDCALWEDGAQRQGEDQLVCRVEIVGV